MKFIWMAAGGAAGLVVGAVLGFCAALVAMSFSTNHNDGSYGMREVIVGLPSGALLGFAAGLVAGLRHAS